MKFGKNSVKKSSYIEHKSWTRLGIVKATGNTHLMWWLTIEICTRKYEIFTFSQYDPTIIISKNSSKLTVISSSSSSLSLSECVRYQEILLHKQLKEEIEKNPASRYVDSELYLRNNQRSPAFDDVSNNVSSSKSEVQSTTLNIGGNFTTTATTTTGTNNSTNSRQIDNNNKTIADNPLRGGEYPMEIVSNLNENSQQQQQQQHKSCQVCLVKEVRQDLMNLNKIIKDRNDQLMTKLKAKRLRSFFERQI